MPHCCVPFCNVQSGKELTKRTKESGIKISFHKIPKDPALLSEFAKRIKREIGPNFQVSRHTSICSLHYRKEDFYEYAAGRRELKPNTLPSIFDSRITKKRKLDHEKRVSLLHEDSSDGMESGQIETVHGNDNISMENPADRLQFKVEKPDPMDASDTDRDEDGMDSENEASNCGTPLEYPVDLLDCKLEEMDPGSETESADEAIAGELKEIDPLNLSDDERGQNGDDHRTDALPTCTTQAEYTVEELHCKLREMTALNGYLKQELSKEKRINHYYEIQFAKLNSDLQNVQAELQQTQEINYRYRTELVKLRYRFQKQSGPNKKEK